MMPKHISQALAILVILGGSLTSQPMPSISQHPLVSSVNALAIGDVGAVHAAPEILAREVVRSIHIIRGPTSTIHLIS